MTLSLIIKIVLLIFLGYAALSDRLTRQIGLVPLALTFICGIVLQFIFGGFQFLDLALACGIGIILLVVAKLSGEALGYGDALLFMTSGIFLGFTENIFLLLFSLLLSALFSVFQILIRRRKMRDSLPFAPFILGGYICVLAIA